tara:strand:- start:664 stop:804 length:141 start_codon:yes stop_codon:yes gene_type:complete
MTLNKWLSNQESIPSRKTVQRMFPDMPKKVIRKALQSFKDRAEEAR